MQAFRSSLAVRATALLLVTAPCTGCFKYVRDDLGAVGAGENVRVYLNPRGRAMADLNLLSPGAEPVVSGEVVEREQDHLLLRLTGLVHTDPYRAPLAQDLGVPAGEILQVQSRHVDVLRTAILGGLGAAAAATVVAAIVSDAFGREPIVGQPEPQLRIPLPWPGR